MKIFLLFFLLQLTGCGVYKSKFDCAPGKGVGCESVSKVNQLVDENALDDFVSGQVRQRPCKDCSNFTSDKKEKMTVHFNEYKDGAGRLHMPHDVQLIL